MPFCDGCMFLCCASVCLCPGRLCSICITTQQAVRVPVVHGYLQNAARHRQVVGGKGKGGGTGEERIPQERDVAGMRRAGDAKREA